MTGIFVLLFLIGCGFSILDRTYYNTLRVPISAGPEEVKEAYRKLSRKYHPDRNQNSRSKFEKINVAYEVLSNEEQKYLYDRLGHEKMNDPNIQQEKNLAAMKGNNLEVQLSVTLEDLFTGKEFVTTIFKNMACPHCSGSGAQNEYDISRCAECQGQGKKVKRVPVGGGYYNMINEVCPRCGGEGKIIGRKCNTCKGGKIVSGSEDFKVKIKPGTSNYQVLKYTNMGEQKLEGAPGDLLVRIRQMPHFQYRRQGSNLYTSVTITLKEALEGFSRKFSQLDGRQLSLQNHQITQPGQTFTLEGEGMPIKDSEEKGNMYVTVNVSIPNYSQSQISELIKLMQSFN